MTAITLPVPKFQVGDVVWIGEAVRTRKQKPCPDCKDTKEWTVTTPAGSEFKTKCQRCGSQNYSRMDEHLSLDYYEAVPLVSRRTVGSIEVKTHGYHGNGITGGSVQYMCNETGAPSSGSVYYEGGDGRHLRATEAEALADAEAEALDENRKLTMDPERMDKLRYSHLELQDAVLKACEDSHWHAWYKYKVLVENINEVLDAEDNSEDAIKSLDDMREFLREEISVKYGSYKIPRLGILLDLALTVCGLDADDSKKALDHLRKFLANMPVELKPFNRDLRSEVEYMKDSF